MIKLKMFDESRISKSMLSLTGILFALYIITGLLDSYNFSIPAIGNIFYLGAALGLLAAGQTICMLTGGIDLSLAMIATGAAFIVSVKSSSGLLVALSLALLYCVVIGAINGLAVGLLGMNPLIMTLGMNAVLIGVFTVGVTTFLQGSSTVPEALVTLSTASIIDTSGWVFESATADPRSWPFFASIVDTLSWPFFIWLLVSLIVLFILARTGLGRLIYAIGDNAQSARLAGVKVWQVQVTTYVMCAILGGIGGIILGGQSGAVALSLANSFLLPSVAAVVIGGTSIMGGIGGYKGTMMGTLILTLLSSLLTTINSSEAVKQMIYGAIVLALAWTYAKISEKS
ncbi:MAG: ABC transporter permease [Actinobacteria bacterium]|nr:ABC transporter permease [Actinomycetota bacterium]